MVTLGTPCLVSFHWGLDGFSYLPGSIDIIDYLNDAVGSLRSLSVSNVQGLGEEDAWPAWEAWSLFISRVANPAELDVGFPLYPYAMKHLASLPDLTHLGFMIPDQCPQGLLWEDIVDEISELTFSKLESLTLYLDYVRSDDPLSFLRTVTSPLKTLRVEWQGNPWDGDIDELVDGLPATVPWLRELRLSTWSVNRDSSDHFLMHASRLSKAFELEHIEKFSAELSLDIDSAFIQAVAHAWPRLVVLKLRNINAVININRSSVVPLDLVPLVKGCPKLEELVITLCGTCDRDTSNGPQTENLPTSLLEKLSVYTVSERKMQDHDTLVLRAMFPQAAFEFYDVEEDEDECSDDER